MYIRFHCSVENAAVSNNLVIIVSVSAVAGFLLIVAVILVIVIIKQRTDVKRSYRLYSVYANLILYLSLFSILTKAEIYFRVIDATMFMMKITRPLVLFFSAWPT